MRGGAGTGLGSGLEAEGPDVAGRLGAGGSTATAGVSTASCLSSGITSAANSRMLRSASSYGMPA